MPIDVEQQFVRGGRPLIEFLSYCVLSVRMEPVFAFLVREYRHRPMAEAAVVLYDAFCAADAPGRLRAADVLPPRERGFEHSMEALRQRWLAACRAQQEAAETEDAEAEPVFLPLPPRYLFDFILRHLEGLAENPLVEAGRCFDPRRSAFENLPGGKLTAGQRAFVEQVWKPRVRPRLVAAGFWRIANIPSS